MNQPKIATGRVARAGEAARLGYRKDETILELEAVMSVNNCWDLTRR